MSKQLTEFDSIQEIRATAKEAGSHWFDASNMRFFESQIEREVYDGRYFISSEMSNQFVLPLDVTTLIFGLYIESSVPMRLNCALRYSLVNLSIV